MSDVTEPLDPRVGELLSAYLDGAVSDEERATAEAWLERSPLARAEYESLAAVKATLGGLGEVEPPFGFFDRMLRQGTPTPEVTSAAVPGRRSRSRARWLAPAGAVAAAAAAFVVVVGQPESVTPPVQEVAAGDAEGVFAVRAGGTTVQALRQDADEVRWGDLPEGIRGRDGGTETWTDLTTDEGEARVVVFRDDVVVTLAGEGVGAEDLIDAGEELARERAEDRGPLASLEDLAESIWPG